MTRGQEHERRTGRSLARRERLAAFIRESIATGTPLPLRKELAVKFRVGSQTIFNVLQDEGLLDQERELRQRRGLPKHPRRGDLVAFVRESIATGTPLPTRKELAGQFGMGLDSVFATLRDEGLLTQARELRQPHGLRHTRDTARFLGMLVGSGRVDPSRHIVALRQEDPYVAAEFKRIAEGFFRRHNPTHNDVYEEERESGKTEVFFHSTRYVSDLGDFRRETVSDTITERHRWVLEEPEYLASFLSGFFDTKAIVDIVGEQAAITFHTKRRNLAFLVRNILQQIGIQNARFLLNLGEIVGVRIRDIEDLHNFASQVNSVNPQKQEQLDFMRNLEVKPRIISKGVTNEAVIAEWKFLTSLYGPDLTTQQIEELRALGKTPYSQTVYKYRFGGKKSRTYEVARRALNEAVGWEDI